eukprot:TRINITY_DN2937_c0_g1_i1.p1 TRINITY_DN2937_c0_g1~~TRINITY_DN2937_c0_g1_i1.p1  ORF type:complete len:485 (+),score=108.45 TRINITY_DN2937_c0_g1_i1:66-1520(+)
MDATTHNNTTTQSTTVGAGLRVYNDVVDAICWSPMIRLNKIGADLECELWAKCEFLNPGGSVKDRIGKQMILDAEKSGRIKPGDILIEPTSGNTGIGLSLVGATKGYNMIITLPQKMSQEKVSVLEGLGAKIIRTPTEAAWDAPESHIGIAKKLNGELANSHILDQYGNPSNPRAHYENTGEELLQQCGDKVDMVVVSAGTGGTITGIAQKVKERSPSCKIVGVDPIGSILAGPATVGSYLVEGIGYDFIPDVLNTKLVDEWVKTEDEESFLMARRLIHEEGLMVGGSAGATVVGALKAAKSLKKGQRCVVLLSDSVRNYITKFLDKRWMIDRGFMSPPAEELKRGDSTKTASDLSLPAPLTLAAGSTIADAISFFSQHHVRFAPVLSKAEGEGQDGGSLLGVVSEQSVLDYLLLKDGSSKQADVKEAFMAEYREVSADTTVQRLYYVVTKNDVAFVTSKKADGNRKVLHAVVTKSDLLRFLHD